MSMVTFGSFLNLTTVRFTSTRSRFDSASYPQRDPHNSDRDIDDDSLVVCRVGTTLSYLNGQHHRKALYHQAC